MGATFGASYTSVANRGTRIVGGSSLPAPLPFWAGTKAIVLPVCSGKSSLCFRFGGYDIDGMVGDASELPDSELDAMLIAREQAYMHQDAGGMDKHNQLMLLRAARFLATVYPDTNPRVVYIHTVEMAVALGLEVIGVFSVEEQAILQSKRMQAYTAQERLIFGRIAREQAAANVTFCQRHGLDQPTRMGSYHALTNRVESLLVQHRVISMGAPDLEYIRQLNNVASERELLSLAERRLYDKSSSSWVKVSACHHITRSLGDAAPQEVHQHCNYVRWAEIVHSISAQRVPASRLNVNFAQAEDVWREEYPLGPGNSSFALVNVSDFLKRTDVASHAGDSYKWFIQLCQRPGITKYERLLCALVMGDVSAYVVPRSGCSTAAQYSEVTASQLLDALDLGCLDDQTYLTVAKAIHAEVRVGCNFLGVPLQPKMLSFFMYFDCLAGRLLGQPTAEGFEAEMQDRITPEKPKKFFINGAWSEAEFDKRLKEAIAVGYDYMATRQTRGLEKIIQQVETFEEFLKHRKTWGRAGSATGSPKADIYLKVPRDHMLAAEEVAAELGDALLIVLRRVRLNKAAFFEFPQFPQLVADALKDFKPNAFTRHFMKSEPGKEGGRYLYPCHLIHYVVVSHVLALCDKAGQLPNSRLNAPPSAQREDHWLWRETMDTSLQFMLDYANFNETHAIKHMQETFTQLKSMYAKLGGLSKDLSNMIEWVVTSLDNMAMEYKDEIVFWTHGLQSGMRNTSHTNHVLNPAYLTVIGQQVEEMTGLPTFIREQTGGDDVAARAGSLYQAAIVLRVGQAMGFKFKAIKQMLGMKYSEFFRLLITPEGVYGSLCRMLGSALSGQWSNSILPKFIEPATKLSSIIEIARKAGRRAMLNLTFMEKLYLCAFDKWATQEEEKIAEELIHGTVASGGLGIPYPDGSILILDGQPERLERPVIVGIPTDASRHVAEAAVKDADELLGPGHTIPANTMAKTMAEAVFQGAVAQALGPRRVRVIGKMRVPKVKAKLSIPREEFSSANSSKFMHWTERCRESVENLRAAGAQYDSLSGAVQPAARRLLARRICDKRGKVDHHLLYFWKEEFFLYGCATYMLTEDYYDDVVMLALLNAPQCNSESVSRVACELAAGLSHDGYMYY
ncbi:putative RNA-dependent RNA polymerase [Colletotrichum fructicola chrysovirus 1]|uniref:RNA-directed RNA polymerase n=1 Tax=Colletotrichum fructicola chrysovirus 1 TaxID=2304034 RepID=A0A346IMD9_9VIRU|nr:putative RNA-dependent RNA polymerase [Colletotrichum fructicola chrysovirus 1]AXP19674.1 putative RNA-dependent RNA polymerase [Colletotrichum fructicola chrysovirus 1]